MQYTIYKIRYKENKMTASIKATAAGKTGQQSNGLNLQIIEIGDINFVFNPWVGYCVHENSRTVTEKC